MSIEANKLVTFRLGEDYFAADIFSVERVLRYSVPTSVPDMPAYIEGVIDYQERVVPIVNLRLRFELPKMDAVPETRTLDIRETPDFVALAAYLRRVLENC